MPVDINKTERLLKTARGQIDGIIKMVDDGRYCIDVVNQLLSLEAIIKKCRKEVLQNHLMTCVASSKEEDFEAKLSEFVKILDKMD